MEGLFRGTWYRSAIELKGDVIFPIPPFEPYNPFDCYYSASQARQGDRSLHLEFLSVDARKPEEVARFCERYGVLGSPLKARRQGIEKMREKKEKEFFECAQEDDGIFSDDSLTHILEGVQYQSNSSLLSPEELCLPLSLSTFHWHQFSFKCAIDLLVPAERAIAKIVPEIKKDFSENFPGKDFYKFYPSLKEPIPRTHAECFESPINEGLFKSNVSPQLKWNIQKQGYELFWHSFSLEGYFWTMLMLDEIGQGKILSCPRCSKFFMTASNRMKYCSSSCYENHKVQRYQKKKKEELLAAQMGKKPKTRKSTGKKK